MVSIVKILCYCTVVWSSVIIMCKIEKKFVNCFTFSVILTHDCTSDVLGFYLHCFSCLCGTTIKLLCPRFDYR